MNTYKKHLLNKYLIVLVVFTLCTGLAAAETATNAGILTLSLQPGLDGKGDIKATSITSAELLGLDGAVIKTATLTGGKAQFDLGSIAGGDYFIRVNNLADDLVPIRIDDPSNATNQYVGQKLRATVIGNLSDPTYRILTFSKGQKEHAVVVYSDGTNDIPETYAYAILYLKTNPKKLEIRALGTASLLNSYSPKTATHPSTPTAANPSFSEWVLGEKNHAIDYNGTDSKCNTCHINLDTKPATFTQVTSFKGWCYRCHYGKTGIDKGFIDTKTLAATPTETSTPAAATAAPTATAKTPAFEALLAISALLVMVLVIRRK